jgi:hypothetical protein
LVKPFELKNFSLEYLTRPCIIRAKSGSPLPGDPLGEQLMKRAVRMLFLMVGMLCAYTALAAPAVPAPEDGAPIPSCTGHCG